MPSLRGGKLADDALRMMKGYFQDAVISLDPVRRLTRGNVDYYFGLSVFLLAVFGCSLWQEKVIARFLGRIDLFCMHDNVYVCYFCKNTGRTLYMDAYSLFRCPVFYII